MKKRIALVLSPVLPVPAIKGGAIETLITLLLDLNETENKVIFEVFCIYDSYAENLAKKYKNSKIHFIKIPKTNFLKRFYRSIKRELQHFLLKNIIVNPYYNSVFKICKEQNYDFIVAESGPAQEFKKFAYTFTKEKLFLHIHSEHFFTSRMKDIFGSTISVSNFVRNTWKKSCELKNAELNQKNYVVLNAVDEDLFLKRIDSIERDKLRESLGIKKDDILILYLGRIVAVKGIIELINAVLKIKNPKVKLLVVGSHNFAVKTNTEYEQQVKKLINSNPDKIKFHPYVNNKEVYKFNQISDLQIFPAQWEEAFCLALIESILSGCANIITNSGGMPEIISNKGTIVVEKGKNLEKNLVTAIENIILEPNKINNMKEANSIHSKNFRKINFYNNFINIFINNNFKQQ